MSDTRPADPALAPYLTLGDAKAAIDFYKEAFGAEELGRMESPDGRLMHADLVINGARVFLCDDFPEMNEGHAGTPKALGGTPVAIHLTIEDVDAAFQRAVNAGATVTMPLEDMFWGSRFGAVEDPFGHRWTMGTPSKPMSEEEMKAAMAAH